MKKTRDKSMGMCRCGHPQQEHEDTHFEVGHGRCKNCSCFRFTWTKFLQEEIPAPIYNINEKEEKIENEN